MASWDCNNCTLSNDSDFLSEMSADKRTLATNLNRRGVVCTSITCIARCISELEAKEGSLDRPGTPTQAKWIGYRFQTLLSSRRIPLNEHEDRVSLLTTRAQHLIVSLSDSGRGWPSSSSICTAETSTQHQQL